ncbi:MAG TPA: protein kinase [Terracidiphilus sp.]|jgi:serine/threonine protein kinase|nr:protein kinase [Terracidiphilus sp.]
MKTCPVCDTPYPDQQHKCPTDGAVLMESREFAPGHLVRGKYRIVCKLGQGGMGEVYLAEHLLLGGQLALKFLAPELSRNPQFIKRFRQEARAAYQLRHPNIVEVADLDQEDDGTLFIAMEYVAGPSLREELHHSHGSFAADRALRIARGLGAGLAAAHARGAVHRDIKPDNILLSSHDGEERAKILDFGIAAMTDGITNISRTHGLLLTPEYAAPEQWRGTPAAQLDGRTDLYALGGVLFEMLTGQTAFHSASTEGWMFQHLQGTPERLGDLCPDAAKKYPGLEKLVMRLLAREREDRPESAVEFLREMEAVQTAGEPAGRRETVVESLPRRRATVVEETLERREQETQDEEGPGFEKIPDCSAEAVKGKGKQSALWPLALVGAVVVVSAFIFWARARVPATEPDRSTPPATQQQSAAPQPETPTPAEPPSAPVSTWTDSATKLMWAGRDNGADVTLAQAYDYCTRLRTAGHSDWKLPQLDELESIYDAKVENAKGNKIKGNIQLSSWWIRSGTPGEKGGENWTVNFGIGYKQSDKTDSATNERALCVRGP